MTPQASTRLTRFGASILALILVTAPAMADGTMTFASFGGGYTESQKKAYIEPFQQETGIRVNVVDYNGGLGEIRAQVEAQNVTWDVVDVEMQDAVRGCDDGLFERLEGIELPDAPDGIAAADDFLPETLHECGVGTIVWSTILAYRTDRFVDKNPSTVNDFFDLETFPGKRGAMKKAQVLLEWALIADGVPAGQVYEVLATEAGVDRAFAKLDTIRGDVVWWETHAQAPQLLADGEVVMTMAANGRIFGAIFQEKQPFAMIWDHQVWNLDLWAIPKGARNPQAARQFIAFASRPDRMAEQTRHISYGPVRRSAAAAVDPAIAPHLPTAEANFRTAMRNNFEFWADHADQLDERLNVWLNK